MFQVPVSPHPSCSVAQGSLLLCCLTLVQQLWWVFESKTLTESVIIAFLFNTSTLTDGIRRISGAFFISKVMLAAKSFLLFTGVRTIPGVLLLPAPFTLPTNGAAVRGARPVLGVHAPDKNLKRQQQVYVFQRHIAPPCKVHRPGHLLNQAIWAHPHNHQDLWGAWRTFLSFLTLLKCGLNREEEKRKMNSAHTEQSHRPQLSYQSTTYYQLLFWYYISTHYGLTLHRKDTGIK